LRHSRVKWIRKTTTIFFPAKQKLECKLESQKPQVVDKKRTTWRMPSSSFTTWGQLPKFNCLRHVQFFYVPNKGRILFNSKSFKKKNEKTFIEPCNDFFGQICGIFLLLKKLPRKNKKLNLKSMIARLGSKSILRYLQVDYADLERSCCVQTSFLFVIFFFTQTTLTWVFNILMWSSSSHISRMAFL
jgi:hypothetical protein